MKPLRIAQLCSSRAYGGMEMHVGILSECLARRGHELIGFCGADSPLASWLEGRHLRTCDFSPRGYVTPLATWRLRRDLRRLSIDLVHVHYSKDLWTLMPAARSLGLPVVFTKHIGVGVSKRDPLHRWLYEGLCHSIAISQAIRQNLIDFHAIAEERMSVVHHGVDLDRYARDSRARAAVRSEFGIGEEEILIGSIGRLQEGKGHLEFLEMARRLASEFPPARFMIVGEPTRGEEEKSASILSRAREIDLGDRLLLTGFRADIPAILSAFDLFVFPAHAEAFGLVVIEAMAAGLPVVSCNSDGILDIVLEGQTGALVAPRDVEALTARVRALLADPQRRRSWGEASLARARESFGIEGMLDRLESIYAGCLESPRRR